MESVRGSNLKFLRDANNRIVTDYRGKIVLVRDPGVKAEPAASPPAPSPSPSSAAPPQPSSVVAPSASSSVASVSDSLPTTPFLRDSHGALLADFNGHPILSPYLQPSVKVEPGTTRARPTSSGGVGSSEEAVARFETSVLPEPAMTRVKPSAKLESKLETHDLPESSDDKSSELAHAYHPHAEHGYHPSDFVTPPRIPMPSSWAPPSTSPDDSFGAFADDEPQGDPNDECGARESGLDQAVVAGANVYHHFVVLKT